MNGDRVPEGIAERAAGEVVADYDRFFRGQPLIYKARRDTFPGTLDVVLEIQHTSRPAGQDAPYEFTERLIAYTGEHSKVVWTSRRTDSQMHRVAKNDGFGDFFNYLEASAEHIHALLRREPSLHDLKACLFHIESQVVADFCISTPKTLRAEIKEKYF